MMNYLHSYIHRFEIVSKKQGLSGDGFHRGQALDFAENFR